MNPLSLIGIGTGIIGGIGQLFGAHRANKTLSRLEGQIPTYQQNPLAAQRTALAQTILNARMPGSAQLQGEIYGNQANELNNINRNATNSAQALSMGAQTQGQTNNAFANLAQQQGQFYQQNVANLNNAYQNQINEGDKVYQSQLNKFGDIAQLEGAKNANRQNAWGSISNLGFGLGNLGMTNQYMQNMQNMYKGDGGGYGFMPDYANGVPMMGVGNRIDYGSSLKLSPYSPKIG